MPIAVIIILITAAVIGRFVYRKAVSVRQPKGYYYTPAWLEAEQKAQKFWAKKN